jgi:hypothetical protein
MDSRHNAERAQEILTLANAHVHGNLSADMARRLERLLLDDPEARQLYVEYLQDSYHLHSLAAHALAAEDEQQPGVEEVAGDQWPLISELATPCPAFPSTIHYPLSTPHYFVGSPLFSYLVAVVILGIGLLIGAITHVSQTEKVVRKALPSPSGRGAGGEGSVAGDIARPTVVGRITGMVDCELGLPSPARGRGAGGEGGPSSGYPVSLGDHFALLSGLLEITYNTGAKVILQGPVTYDVESPAGGFLSVGKLAARVENTESQDLRPKTQDLNPKSPNLQVSKFVVRTPTATVTDLGTEFGVEVGRAGLTHVHVFRGVVDAQLVNPRHGAESHRRLVEGEAVEIGRSSGNLQMIAFAPRLFTRKLQPVTDLSAETAYIKAVLADKPLGYWPLNEPARAREFLDHSGNDAHGRMMGNLKAGQPGPLGGNSRAIELDGNGYVDLGRHDQFAVKNNFTVEAWLWIGAVKAHGIAFSVFGQGEKPNGWTLMAGRRPPEGPAVLQFGISNVQEVDFPLPPDLAIENRWIHVAVSYDRNNTVWLFVNGVSYASAPVGMPISVQPAWLAIGAAEQVGPVESVNTARWHGRIAHVAVYAEELSVQQIQSHCRQRIYGREEAPDKHP